MSFVAAAIVTATAVTANQASKARKSAEQAAAEQQRIMQEAENTRQREAQAEAERLRQAEISRQNNIAAGQGEINSAFAQFNDDFYGNRSKSYIDYATPTLEKQYQDQMRSLTSALARSGNLQSSLRGDMMGKLQTEYDQGKQKIASTAMSYADQARAKAEEARASLMTTNATLADPGQIRNSAAAAAANLRINPQFANLGSLLSNLAANVQVNGAPAQAGTAAGGVDLYNTELTGGGARLVS